MPSFMPVPTIRSVVPAFLAAGVLIAGCATQNGSSADGGAATSGAGGTSTVDVTIQEFSVNPSVDSAPAGELTFNVTNDGPDDVHEFVVIATDLDAGELPTDENGTVDEEGEGMEVIDEIEDLLVGESQELTVDLEAGHYVLICNIFDEAEAEAHYQMGMHTNFEVTD